MLATVLAVAACAGTIDSPPPIATTPEVTPMEGPWIALFDGTSTAALRGYGAEVFPTSWVVEDGELHALPGTGVDLITREHVRRFRARVRMARERGRQQRRHLPGRRERRAVVDDAAPNTRCSTTAGIPTARDPRTSAAALYGLIAPNADKRLEPVGDVQHGADRRPRRTGRALAQRQPRRRLRVERRRRASARRRQQVPGLCRRSWRPTAGGVVLQHHGEEVWFRNVRIRRLT